MVSLSLLQHNTRGEHYLLSGLSKEDFILLLILFELIRSPKEMKYGLQIEPDFY